MIFKRLIISNFIYYQITKHYQDLLTILLQDIRYSYELESTFDRFFWAIHSIWVVNPDCFDSISKERIKLYIISRVLATQIFVKRGYLKNFLALLPCSIGVLILGVFLLFFHHFSPIVGVMRDFTAQILIFSRKLKNILEYFSCLYIFFIRS